MRFVLRSLITALALALTRCNPSPMTQDSSMLRHDPADVYQGPALGLAEAIRRGGHGGLRTLAASHRDAVDSTGMKGIPLLAWAIGHDDPTATEILLSAGADPNVTFPIGAWKMSLVSLAASAQDPRFLASLLRHGADPGGLPDTEPPLFSAIKADRYDRIEPLLRAGADINQRDSAGKTALLMMALTGDYPQALAFVRLGADPSIAMNNGTTLERLISKFPAEPGTPQHAAQIELMGWLHRAPR